MPRAPHTILVTDTAGTAKSGASVTYRRRSDSALATWYSAETGGAGTTAAGTTDASGRHVAYFDRGAYKATVSGSGITTYDELFDVAPGGDGSVDTAWLSSVALPIGGIMPYAGETDPAGGAWLICDGRAVSRSTYSALFGIAGTLYGAGNGSTTFNLPDLQGRFPIGKGTHANVNARGKNEGESLASRQPKHKHNRGDLAVAQKSISHDHNTNVTGPISAAGGANFGAAGWTDQSSGADTGATDPQHNHDLTGSIGDTTSGMTDTVPHLVVGFIIRAL